jgi:predicted nuclease of restriction endonuclease-like (RecB) superfamily
MQIQQQFTEITSLIASAKAKAYQAVNRELVTLYWQVGEYLSNKVKANEWGKSVVEDLANFIKTAEPNIKGFSAQNLWRMKQFYETYLHNEILSPLVREISWTNNLIILSCPSEQERAFYLRMSIKEKWSKLELQRQINSSYYERVMLADAKLATLSRELLQDEFMKNLNNDNLKMIA